MREHEHHHKDGAVVRHVHEAGEFDHQHGEILGLPGIHWAWVSPGDQAQDRTGPGWEDA